LAICFSRLPEVFALASFASFASFDYRDLLLLLLLLILCKDGGWVVEGSCCELEVTEQEKQKTGGERGDPTMKETAARSRLYHHTPS
jgi:hypothetical protein